MRALRHLWLAFQDQDQATPAERVVIVLALLVLIVGAGMSDGPP